MKIVELGMIERATRDQSEIDDIKATLQRSADMLDEMLVMSLDIAEIELGDVLRTLQSHTTDAGLSRISAHTGTIRGIAVKAAAIIEEVHRIHNKLGVHAHKVPVLSAVSS